MLRGIRRWRGRWCEKGGAALPAEPVIGGRFGLTRGTCDPCVATHRRGGGGWGAGGAAGHTQISGKRARALPPPPPPPPPPAAIPGSLDRAPVAGPVVADEAVERPGGDATLAELARVLGQEVLDEERDVAPPIAERRELDRHDVQAIVEVLAEAPLLHERLEISVGRREHAHVDADRVGPAHALDRALLEHAQELRLELDRHVADLVEVERPPVGELELAELPLLRVRERAALVAEHLRLEERRRDRGAGHRHERAPGPAAVVVDRARDQLLARTRLPAEEHGDVARGVAPDRLVDILHARVPAVDRAELPHLLEPALELPHLLREPARGERPLGEEHELVEVEGLRQVVVGPTLHRLDRGVHRPVGRHHDHGGVGAQLAEPRQHGEAVHARHPHVEKDEVERLGLEGLERAGAVLHRRDLVPRPPEPLLEDPAQAVFVVGEQDSWVHGVILAIGRKHVTTVPRPSALSTWIAPRCSSRIRWQMASPSPRPLSLVVKNVSKIRARAAAGIPPPSSATLASTMLRCPAPRSILPKRGLRLTRVVSVRRPPDGIASNALRRRVWNTCTSRSSSPRIGGRLGS